MVAQWRRNANEKRLDKNCRRRRISIYEIQILPNSQNLATDTKPFNQYADETEYNTSSNTLLALAVRTDDFRMVS